LVRAGPSDEAHARSIGSGYRLPSLEDRQNIAAPKLAQAKVGWLAWFLKDQTGAPAVLASRLELAPHQQSPSACR